MAYLIIIILYGVNMAKYASVKTRPKIQEDTVYYNGKKTSHKKVKVGDKELDIYNGFQNPEAYEDYEYNGKVYKVRKDVRPGLERLMAGAKAEGITIPMSSSYRDYNGQVNSYKESGGSGSAATPGYSRHGFGEAFDFSDPRHPAKGKNVTKNYEITPTYKWLAANAHKYGFIAPQEMYAGSKPEPWHYEYYSEYDPYTQQQQVVAQAVPDKPVPIQPSIIQPKQIDYGKTLAGQLAYAPIQLPQELPTLAYGGQ